MFGCADNVNAHGGFDLDQRAHGNHLHPCPLQSVSRMIVVAQCSPYLLKPLRTLEEACSDILASHPELIPPECDVHANTDTSAVCTRGRSFASDNDNYRM
jgi:hypothetical protein